MISRLANKVSREVRYYKDLKLTPINRRHDDLYLVSFPKSGVTWLSTLVAKMGLLLECENREINLFNVQDFVPDIHVSRNVAEKSPFSKLGFRVFKSHSSFNCHYKKVIHLVRDPRDAMVSYYNYLTTLGQYSGAISDLIRDKRLGVDAWVYHTTSWLSDVPSDTLMNFIRYEDLKNDPKKVLTHILLLFGYVNVDNLVSVSIASQDLNVMRTFEKAYSENNLSIEENHEFVRKGLVGGWRTILSIEDVSFINQRAAPLLLQLGYERN